LPIHVIEHPKIRGYS